MSHNMNIHRLAVAYHRKCQLSCRHGRLVDGLHHNKNLQQEWVYTLNKSLDLNRPRPTVQPAKCQSDDEDLYSDILHSERLWTWINVAFVRRLSGMDGSTTIHKIRTTESIISFFILLLTEFPVCFQQYGLCIVVYHCTTQAKLLNLLNGIV